MLGRKNVTYGVGVALRARFNHDILFLLFFLFRRWVRKMEIMVVPAAERETHDGKNGIDLVLLATEVLLDAAVGTMMAKKVTTRLEGSRADKWRTA